jgi:hypothetical protein
VIVRENDDVKSARSLYLYRSDKSAVQSASR